LVELPVVSALRALPDSRISMRNVANACHRARRLARADEDKNVLVS